MNKVILKDLCKDNEIGKYGIPASAEEFDIGKLRYLRISDIDDNGNLLNNDKKSVWSDDIDKYILEEGDLVVARTGNSTGRTYFHEEKNGKLAFAGFLIKYGLDENKLNPKFLKYYTISNEYRQWVKNLSVGSTRGNINAQTFANCPINLPTPIQQNLLVDVLSALDDKIGLNNRINTELEAIAKTLYDYWFVQFDFPDADGKPYKSSGGKMVYNEILRRNIPEDWEVKSLEDLISTDKSGDWGKEKAEGNYITKVECIRGTDINGINGKGEVKSPVRFILEKNEHKILSNLDLVVEISGGSPTQSTGRLAYITEEVTERFQNPLICSNFCKAISLKAEDSFFFFVYSWNRGYDHGVFFDYEGKTSGIKNLLFDTLVSNYHVPLPDKKRLKDFQLKVSLFEKQRQKNLKQNQELSTLRDWLLPMLMNGQISVGKAYEQDEGSLSIAAEDNFEYNRTPGKYKPL